MTKQPKTPGEHLRERSFIMMLMLSLMFVFGMGVNLLGLPAETEGAANITSTILLSLHGLLGVGLIVNAILVIVFASKLTTALQRQAWIGITAIVLTFVCGVLTWALDNDWYSYGMALGFLVSFWLYGALYLKSNKV